MLAPNGRQGTVPWVSRYPLDQLDQLRCSIYLGFLSDANKQSYVERRRGEESERQISSPMLPRWEFGTLTTADACRENTAVGSRLGSGLLYVVTCLSHLSYSPRARALGFVGPLPACHLLPYCPQSVSHEPSCDFPYNNKIPLGVIAFIARPSAVALHFIADIAAIAFESCVGGFLPCVQPLQPLLLQHEPMRPPFPCAIRTKVVPPSGLPYVPRYMLAHELLFEDHASDRSFDIR